MAVDRFRCFDIIYRVLMRGNSNNWTIFLMQLDIREFEAPFVDLNEIPPSSKPCEKRTWNVSQRVSNEIDNKIENKKATSPEGKAAK